MLFSCVAPTGQGFPFPFPLVPMALPWARLCSALSLLLIAAFVPQASLRVSTYCTCVVAHNAIITSRNHAPWIRASPFKEPRINKVQYYCAFILRRAFSVPGTPLLFEFHINMMDLTGYVCFSTNSAIMGVYFSICAYEPLLKGEEICWTK